MGFIAPVVAGLGSAFGGGLSAVGGLASIAGIGLQAYSSYKGAKAENNAADYNAAIMRNNAITSEQQAQQAREAGELEEKQQRLRASRLEGQNRASIGASGVLSDSGSVLDVLADNAMFAEQDALTIRQNASQQAWGYNVQAQTYRDNARLTTMGKRSPFLAAGGTLLSGLGSTPWGQIFRK